MTTPPRDPAALADAFDVFADRASVPFPADLRIQNAACALLGGWALDHRAEIAAALRAPLSTPTESHRLAAEEIAPNEITMHDPSCWLLHGGGCDCSLASTPVWQAVKAICDEVGVWKNWGHWQAQNHVAAIIAKHCAPLPLSGDEWMDIGTHDGSMNHVEGWNEKMGVHETWYFAPSSQTRDWWIVGVPNRKWQPTHFRALKSTPPSSRKTTDGAENAEG